MASGIFVVPILTIFGHIDIRTAIGASIVSVIACSCSSAAPFLKARLTNVRLAIVLETATTAGALSGVLLAGAIQRSYLFLIFGVILLLSAHQMLAKRHHPALASTQPPTYRSMRHLESSYPDRVRFPPPKEVVGTPGLLGLSFFGGGILRRLLPHVSLAKSISAPLPF